MPVSSIQLSQYRTTAILLIATKRDVSTAQIRKEYMANDKKTCSMVARFIEIRVECENKPKLVDDYA